MLRNTVILVVLSVAFLATGKCDDVEPLPRMIAGVNTVPGEAPSVVSIRIPAHNAEGTITYCVGTIVNPTHVVTATQCVHNATNHLINPFWVRIVAGDLNIMVPNYRRFTTNATHIYTHPAYTVAPRTNDIAVIRTSSPFPFPHNTIDWAVRNTRALPNGQECRYIGWGAPAVAGAINPIQQRITVPILDRAACNAGNVHGGQVQENMICAGSLAANPPTGSVCTGNVGGGLFCNVGGWWEYTGVLSFGIGCGVANQPGVYTQIRFFETWIVQQFGRTDATLPGASVVV